VSSVREAEFPSVDIRPMHELDIPLVVAVEKAAYQFPWSEGIFRDCLRVGYVCRVVDVAGDLAGYGIMSVGRTSALRRDARGFLGSTALQRSRCAPLSFSGI
jgi:hypothetical protein